MRDKPHKRNRSLERPQEIPGPRVHGLHRRDPGLEERAFTRTASGHSDGPERPGFDLGSRARNGAVPGQEKPRLKAGLFAWSPVLLVER